MANKCKTCAHPASAEINKLIASNVALCRIASDFGLTERMVQVHAKNHLKPIVAEANQLAKVAIIAKITKYREEVNYSALDKIKWLQDRILKDIDDSFYALLRPSLYREFRTAVAEEAKLCGLYQQTSATDQDYANLVANIKRVAVKFGTSYQEELKVFLSEFADRLRPEFKARLESEVEQ